MRGIWKKIVATLATNRFVMAISGWGSWFVSSWLFDDLLYPAVIAWLGPVYGGIIMSIAASLICYFWTKAIVASDNDWFEMKTLHKIQKIVFWIVRICENIPFVRKSWVQAIEYVLTFFALCVATDAMIVTLYFRRDDKSKVLSRKDWKVFVWSLLISNLYWTLRSWGLVELIKYSWNLDYMPIFQAIQKGLIIYWETVWYLINLVKSFFG